MRRIAWFTFIILATLTLAILLWEFRVAVVLFVLSLAVAATVRPLVDWYAARGLPRGIALWLTYAACAAAVAGLVLILSGPFLANLEQFTADLASGYTQIQTRWPEGSLFQRTLVHYLPASQDISQAVIGAQGSTVVQLAVGLTLSWFDRFGQMMIVLVLSLYWSGDQEHFKRLWLSLLPFDHRARAREIWQAIESGFGAYLRSELIQSILAVLLLSTGYMLLGIRYPVVLAVIGGIGWLVPWVGVLLAVIPVALVGLSISPWMSVLAAIFTIGVLVFLEFVVEPRLFKRDRYSSLLAVIVMLILVYQYGLIAILVAPPMAAVIQIFALQLIRQTTLSTADPINPAASTAQPIPVLKDRLTAVQARISDQAETRPELASLVSRLTSLIERAEQEENRAEGTGGGPSGKSRGSQAG